MADETPASAVEQCARWAAATFGPAERFTPSEAATKAVRAEELRRGLMPSPWPIETPADVAKAILRPGGLRW